jgi:hypothetical protein
VESLNHRRRRRNPESGITLAVSMSIIVALVGLGLAAVWLSSINMGGARNLMFRQQARNAAFAGIQHSRVLLAVYLNNGLSLDPILAGQTHPLDDLPTTSNVSGKGAILYDSGTALVDFRYPVGQTALGSYTVWVRNDTADINASVTDPGGGGMNHDRNTTVIVRALGKDPTGTSQVVIEAAIVANAGGGLGSLNNFLWNKDFDRANSNAAVGSVKF